MEVSGFPGWFLFAVPKFRTTIAKAMESMREQFGVLDLV